eukprot:10095107-Heterocapsa_arctica.AAC.1
MIDPVKKKFQEVKVRLTRPEHIGQDAVELDAERACAPDRAVELRWCPRTAAKGLRLPRSRPGCNPNHTFEPDNCKFGNGPPRVPRVPVVDEHDSGKDGLSAMPGDIDATHLMDASKEAPSEGS